MTEGLRTIVKQAIDRADPIGLLAIGCPDDEYDPEIDRVMGYAMAYSDPRQLGGRIHQTFVEMFDERIAGPPEVYDHIAEEIIGGIAQAGTPPARR